MCRFNHSLTIPAVYDGATDMISCSAAVVDSSGVFAGGSVPLEVALNAQQYGPPSVAYRYYSTPQVSARRLSSSIESASRSVRYKSSARRGRTFCNNSMSPHGILKAQRPKIPLTRLGCFIFFLLALAF